jgi:hypothetical protein
MRKARLLVPIPLERVLDGGDGTIPNPGDIVVLDQGFMFPDGKSGGMVYYETDDGQIKYEAEVYDTELEVVSDE